MKLVLHPLAQNAISMARALHNRAVGGVVSPPMKSAMPISPSLPTMAISAEEPSANT